MRLPLVLPFLDPVVRASARVDPFVHHRDVIAPGLHRDAEALIGPVRHVDVEERELRDAVLEHLLRDDRGRARRGAKLEFIAPVEILCRHGDCRNPEQRALERTGHRARIRHIVAEIPSLVDARDDEIGLLLDDVRDRQVHAVGRRAVDAVGLRPDRLDAQRTAQRERVADRARLLHRRDDRHISEMSQRRRERLDTLGVHAIVVGDQNFTHRNL